MQKLFTAEEISKFLGLRPSTIKNWARRGLIPSLKVSPKAIRFDLTEVIDTIKGRRDRDGKISCDNCSQHSIENRPSGFDPKTKKYYCETCAIKIDHFRREG